MFRLITSKFRFGVVKDSLQSTLISKFAPINLRIVDESLSHTRGKESHFNVYIVSQKFNQLSRMHRHKLVYEELGNYILLFRWFIEWFSWPYTFMQNSSRTISQWRTKFKPRLCSQKMQWWNGNGNGDESKK